MDQEIVLKEAHNIVGSLKRIEQTTSKVKTAIQLMTRRTPDFYIPFLRELSYF